MNICESIKKEIDDFTYLSSMPGMMQSIEEVINTPLSECIPLSEV